MTRAGFRKGLALRRYTGVHRDGALSVEFLAHCVAMGEDRRRAEHRRSLRLHSDGQPVYLGEVWSGPVTFYGMVPGDKGPLSCTLELASPADVLTLNPLLAAITFDDDGSVRADGVPIECSVNALPDPDELDANEAWQPVDGPALQYGVDWFSERDWHARAAAFEAAAESGKVLIRHGDGPWVLAGTGLTFGDPSRAAGHAYSAAPKGQGITRDELLAAGTFEGYDYGEWSGT